MICDWGIVGGGPGGLYAAVRLTQVNATVCQFEATSRLGGRVHTLRNLGPKKDLVVDVGAYRFARHLTADSEDTTCV